MTKISMHGRIEEMGSLDGLPRGAVSGIRVAVGDTVLTLPLTFEQTRQVAQADLLFKDLTITISLGEA